jgi:sialate O-acetylesterase
MKQLSRISLSIFFGCCFSLLASADIRLPAIFTDNMVLQQQASDPVWGWASPGEEISIKGSWNENAPVKTKADVQGKWMAKIKTPQAGGPYTLTIQGSQTIVLHNVMIGEVWVCSGQSNMSMPVSGWGEKMPILHSAEEIQEAKYPDIRLFTVKQDIAFEPQEDCKGSWSACTPETVASFSATAYFFGRDLYQKLKVPIGLIHSSWGGTVAEAWTSESALRKLGDFNAKLDKLDSMQQHPNEISDKEHKNPNQTTVLFNGMIAPLIPFGIRGAIWYQGESNVGRASQYARLFPALIHDWRTRWQEGDFPFYFVQIAPFPYGRNGRSSAALRDAQRRSLKVPNTGMAVTLDIGDTTNIHPANKQEVGRRLSIWALSKVYHEKGIAYSGPLYKGMKIKGDKVILSFNYADGGLITRGGKLTYFEIAGADGNFVPAEAIIDGKKVIVHAGGIAHPKKVRFAWSDNAEPHLFNQSGLPASTFSTEMPE